MSDYPEHDKLALRRDEAAVLTTLWDWMRENKLKVCRLDKRWTTQLVVCDECEATGRNLESLTDRQRQVVQHFQTISQGLPYVSGAKKKQRDEDLADLMTYVESLPECRRCRGKGKAQIDVQIDGEEYKPAYYDPHQFIAAFLEIDKRAFDAEKEAMFASIRQDIIVDKPMSAEPETEKA